MKIDLNHLDTPPPARATAGDVAIGLLAILLLLCGVISSAVGVLYLIGVLL